MRYYPVFLDLIDRPCAVVGGGEVAERKALSLLQAGASVTVISPKVTGAIARLSKEGRLTLLKSDYKEGDLEGYCIVISATDSKETNRAVSEEARKRNIPVNVVDDPALCSFIVPSVVDRGSLMIAISTSGKSPYLARVLRETIEETIGREYETFIEILGAARKKLLKSRMNHDKKERVIKELVKSPIPELLKENRAGEIDAILERLLGRSYTLDSLGIRVKGRASASLSRGMRGKSSK